MACVHTAAAIRDFVALENHSLDIPWWKDLVTGLSNPFLKDGYVDVPEKPGLGIDLNPEVIKEHLMYPGYFEPTPEWDIPHLGFYNPPSGIVLSHAKNIAETAGAKGNLIESIAHQMVNENNINIIRAKELLVK
jgi:hypothetical protein